MGPGVVLNAPGSGWSRLAAEVAAALPVSEVDGIWVFRSLRQGGREWGTAIVSRVDGERRRIYTARFVHTLKGRDRGRFESTLEEVGSGPAEALAELIGGVRRRLDEEEPTPVPPLTWFPPEPPTPGSVPSDDAARTG